MHGHVHHLGEKKLIGFWLLGSFIGAIFIANSYILKYALKQGDSVAGICAFIGALILGLPVVIRAIKDLVRGELHMNELAAIAVLACFARGDYTTAGVVSFLVLVGDIIEHRTAIGVHESIETLLKLVPQKARLIEDGREREIEASSLKPGQTIRIRPGENVPVDGTIEEGTSALNEATITGESLPADKGVGQAVFAGTLNLTGAIKVRVTKIGEDTTLGRVRHLIKDAEATRIPIMTVIDRYMSWYTPVVLMISAIILAVTKDLNNAITALIVTCPCALILATPTAMVAALSASARLGILIKNVHDLESASQISSIVFDKTGTLTTGVLAVARISPVDGVTSADLLSTAASAESHSNHPMARAIMSVAKETALEIIKPGDYKEISGRGIEAVVADKKVFVGRHEWLRQNNITIDQNTEQDTDYSTLYVARDGKLLGWIGFEDKVRPEARKATEDLKNWGIKQIIMLTGDRYPVAKKVSEDLGCTDFEAQCLPQRKLEVVNGMKDKGEKVAVIGDGINDAPALAAGDIGIAMGAAGSDEAINSATIALMSEDLSRLPMLFKLSKKTRWAVNENLIFGGLFIAGGLCLAGFGVLTPIIAAILHNIGSFVVIFNSARLVRFGEHIRRE